MAEETQALTTRTFPQSVHDSLAELRQIAKRAKSREDPALRWATEDEIALATSLRKAWHCSGHSGRTGLPCEKARVLGTTVCVRHGAATPQVKAAIDQRLREMANPVLGRMFKLSMQDKHLPSAVNAGKDLLDRAGVGAVVDAKVRSAGRDQGNKIQVVIGFLGTADQPAPTMLVGGEPAAAVVEHHPAGNTEGSHS